MKPVQTNSENVKFEKILLEDENLYQNQSPFDKLIHNEILRKTSKDLTAFYPESNFLSSCLDDVHFICEASYNLVFQLRTLVIKANGSLECDESNCVYVKKIHRLRKHGYLTQRYEFHLRIGFVDQISYKDIIFPPLSNFNMSVQYLPSGIEFIKQFLHNPMEYYLSNN